MNRRIGSLLATACAVTLTAESVHAFAQPTHEDLSATAVHQSNLDDFLKSNFPEYWQGIGQLIGPNGEPVIDLIGDGSHDEDEPLYRVVWHFHDPTRPWSEAGVLGGLFDSSIYRQQEADSRYMWEEAREAYSDRAARDEPGGSRGLLAGDLLSAHEIAA